MGMVMVMVMVIPRINIPNTMKRHIRRHTSPPLIIYMYMYNTMQRHIRSQP